MTAINMPLIDTTSSIGKPPLSPELFLDRTVTNGELLSLTYRVEALDGTLIERGFGAYNGSKTIQRIRCYSSSNANDFVDLPLGRKNIFIEAFHPRYLVNGCQFATRASDLDVECVPVSCPGKLALVGIEPPYDVYLCDGAQWKLLQPAD